MRIKHEPPSDLEIAFAVADMQRELADSLATLDRMAFFLDDGPAFLVWYPTGYMSNPWRCPVSEWEVNDDDGPIRGRYCEPHPVFVRGGLDN